MKKEIGIIISNPFYIRNYLLTDAFSEIKKNYNLTFLVSHNLKELRNDKRFQKNKIIIYKYPQFLDKIARLVNEISLFKNLTKSKDFAYRIKRKYNDSPHLNDGTLFAKSINLRIKVFTLKVFFKLLSKNKIPILINSIAKYLFSKYSPIQKILRANNFEILMCPCSAAGTEEFDLGAYTSNSKNTTKTVLIIDNWDNLSSKYVMAFQPTHTIVWGEQTRLHGITFQNIKPEKITAIGTPRFYCYSKAFNLKNKKKIHLPHLPEKYILFLGSQTYYDENLVLRKLKDLLKDRLSGFKIVYRPHPWREKASKPVKSVKGIIIDPTLRIGSDKFGSILLPKLDLYNHIISNASVIIGGCTSMIIESSLMRKPYLLLAHNDGNPIQSPFEYYKASEHQNLTGILNNILVCYSLDKLYEQIILLMNKKILVSDPVLEYIISPKYSHFSIHLNKLIEKKIIV